MKRGNSKGKRLLWSLISLCLILSLVILPTQLKVKADVGDLTMQNHSITWINGDSKTVISEDGSNLSITPNNQEASVTARVTFSCGGDERIETGKAEIRLPRSVYYDREGNPIDTVELSIPKAPAVGGPTSFNYIIDDKGTPDDPTDDEIVIRNYEPISAGGFFMKADIVWKFNAVFVKNGYTKDDISASFSAEGNGGNGAITADSNTISTSVHTSINQSTPTKKAVGKKESWQSIWGPKPTDADDYFYIEWELYQYISNVYATVPFKLQFEEVPGGSGGEVVAWANSKSTSSNYGDYKLGNIDEMNEEILRDKKTPQDLSNSQTVSTYRKVVMRYPKSMVADGSSPTITNTFKSKITTVDGDVYEKVALSSYQYQVVNQDIPYGQDVFTMYKRARAGYLENNLRDYSSFKGAINMLRNGTPVEADWAIDVKNMSWNRTANGTKSYDTILRDGMMYIAGERLTPDDYELSAFYPSQFDSYVGQFNEDTGAELVISKDYTNQEIYAPIKVEIKDAAGNWSYFGEFTKVDINSYQWQGADGSSKTASYGTSNSSTYRKDAIELPEGTQDIKFIQSSKTYGVEYRMGLYYKLKPSQHLLNLIGADTTAFNLININEAWAEQDGIRYTQGNEFNSQSTANIKADVEQQDIQEFGSTNAVLHDYSTHEFTYITGSGNFSKTMSTPVNDINNQRVKVPVNMTWDYYYNYKNLGIDIESAIAANIINESRDAIFYDLLPKGVTVDLKSIVARTYCYTNVDKKSMPKCEYTVEMVNNWRDSGRTMMIVNVKAPDGYRNYDKSDTYVDTGFRLSFDMYTSWDNLAVNGTKLYNDAALYCKEGPVPNGVSDTGVGSSDKDLFENLAGDGADQDLKDNVRYAKANRAINVPIASQMGFEKNVKGAADVSYSKKASIPAGGAYSYQMRFALDENSKARGVVLYDVLEKAHDGKSNWTGSFTGVDTSIIRNQFPDVDLQVYYSTSNEFADLRVDSGIDYTDLTNADIWTTTPPDDLSTVTAVAIDMSKDKAGNIKEYKGEIAVTAEVFMQAPLNYEDYTDNPDTPNVDETAYAYNQSFAKEAGKKAEPSDITKVELVRPDITIVKSSDPVSGTAATPKKLIAGESIEYVLNVTNNNAADAIKDVDIVDLIPENLEIDKDNLAYYFGSQKTTRKNISETTRINATIDGQKITFNIDKLSGLESVKLIIPVTIKDTTNVGQVIENSATITKFNDREWEDYTSNKTYHSITSAKLSIPVRKTIIGDRTPTNKAFDFKIEAVGNAPLPSSTTRTIAGQAKLYFPSIEYKLPGEYKYLVSEVAKSDKGYTYDSTIHHVTVTVEKTSATTLKASWVDEDGETGADAVTFTNEYHPEPVKLKIPVNKTIGGDIVPSDHQDEFEFVLSGPDTNPMPDGDGNKLKIGNISNDNYNRIGRAKGEFGEITFTKPGTYTYRVDETRGNYTGYVYDRSTHAIEVTVVDKNGQLVATWTDNGRTTSEVNFENDYKPNAYVVAFDFKKTVTGHERKDEFKKSFKFQLDFVKYTGSYDFKAARENHPMPASNITTVIDSGTAVFGEMAIEHAGKYEYIISEIDDGAAGYTYDANKCYVVVNAVDNKGNIEATVTYTYVDSNNQTVNTDTFTNVYNPSVVKETFEISKEVTGSDRPANNKKTFEFKLEAEADAPLPTGNGTKATVNDSGKATFGEITFTKSGTYTYKITETNSNEKGYTYSDLVYKAIIEVTDNDGVLEKTVTYKKYENETATDSTNVDEVKFTNKYLPKATTYKVPVKKVITGADRPKDNKKTFDFEIEAQGEAPMPEDDGNYASIIDEGSSNFGDITFTKAGDYTYTVKELIGTDKAYSYSTDIYIVDVSVIDNDGELVADVTFKKGNATVTDIIFTNTYTPEKVKVTIPVNKVISGNNRPDNKKNFDFVLTALTTNAPLPTGDGARVTINDSGTGDFGEITFAKVGVYEYEVEEVKGNEPGYTYSTDKYKVLVEVTDQEGQLKADIKYSLGTESKNDITFENIYNPKETTLLLPVSKIVTGNDRQENNKKIFTFTLEGKDQAPMPEKGKELATIEDEGNTAFGEITYKEAGVYKYTVSEVDNGANSYIYSKKVYDVEVEVIDNNGTLTNKVNITENGQDADALLFENEYNPTATELSILVNKIITGDDRPESKENFIFKLTANTTDAPLPEGDGSEINITDEGSANFGKIIFNQVGNYEYKITEVEGNASGYKYSKDVFTVKVVVTDNDGELETLVTYNKTDENGSKGVDGVEFVNEYKKPLISSLDQDKDINEEVSEPSNNVSETENAKVSNTGNTNNSYIWILAIIAASGIGLITLAIIRKKKNS